MKIFPNFPDFSGFSDSDFGQINIQIGNRVGPPPTVRRRGVRQLLAIMDKDADFSSMGQDPPLYQPLIVPDIDFNADHYNKMIKIQHDGVGHYYYAPAKFYGRTVRAAKVRLTVPPLLRKLTRHEIISFLKKPLITDYICHAQPCERGVSITSEATSSKMTYDLQLGQALMAERCRHDRPHIIRKRLFRNSE